MSREAQGHRPASLESVFSKRIIITGSSHLAQVRKCVCVPEDCELFDGSKMAARWIPRCWYGWSCWRPRCVFLHDAGQERHDHIRDLADIWAEAVGRIKEQTVGIAESSVEAGFSGPGADNSTNAAATAVGKPVGEARLLGSAEHSVLTFDAATAVAEPAQEARPLGIAKHSGSTVEAGSSWPGGRDTDDTRRAAATAVVENLLVNLGLLGLQSTVPRRHPKSQAVPPLQQSQTLLMKLGLLELQSTWPQENPYSQSLLVSLAMVKLGHLGLRSTAPRRNPNMQSIPVQFARPFPPLQQSQLWPESRAPWAQPPTPS